jgi:hypothetical protein
MFEREPVKIYRMTLGKVIANLSGIKECPKDQFKQEIVDAFDGYDYEDVEDITGFEKWCDISQNGEYSVNVRLDHPDAYEFTLYILVKDDKVSVENVL